MLWLLVEAMWNMLRAFSSRVKEMVLREHMIGWVA